MWQAFDTDGLEFRRIAGGKLEGRIFSLTFICYRHCVYIPRAQGEYFVCAGCGTAYDKRIRPAYTVLAYRSMDPMRIRNAIERAKKLPIPHAETTDDLYMTFDLDEGEAAE